MPDQKPVPEPSTNGEEAQQVSIAIKGLSKTYTPRGPAALSNLDLDIGPGLFGLVGPNGAGKTTLMRILTTLIKPTSGTAFVCGYQVDDPKGRWGVKSIIGYLPQELVLYGELTAYEFLDFMAAIKGLGKARQRRGYVEHSIEVTGLSTVAKRHIKSYSGGMKRRVGIAQALLGNPKVLIVDEPTAGLDPHERVRFRNMLVEMAKERLVLLSTHIVEDVAQTCSRVGVLNRGELLFEGAVTDLISYARGHVWEIEADDYSPTAQVVLVASSRTTRGMSYRVLANDPPHATARSAESTLEDSYLWLMNEASASAQV